MNRLRLGVGYYRGISQWSKSEYSGANNSEDDCAVIGSHGLAVRADEVGAAGNYTATASAAATGCNLDSVASALQPGTYYLRIDNVGYGDPLNTGYSTYGSRGAYSLTVAPS